MSERLRAWADGTERIDVDDLRNDVRVLIANHDTLKEQLRRTLFEALSGYPWTKNVSDSDAQMKLVDRHIASLLD